MQNKPGAMNCGNFCLDGKNESSNSTTSKVIQQCLPHFWNSSYTPANTNPALHNVVHYSSPEFTNYNNYLVQPYHHTDSYHSYYNHSNALGQRNFQPFLGAQTYSTAQECRNRQQPHYQQHAANHFPGSVPRSNRNQKRRNGNKQKLTARKKQNTFSPTLPMLNCINTENGNQERNVETTENIFLNEESQLLSVVNEDCTNGTVAKSDCVLNDIFLNETTWPQSTAGSKGMNDFNLGENIYNQEENIPNFEYGNSTQHIEFNMNGDDAMATDVDNMHPLDVAKCPDASKVNLLLSAESTPNVNMHNNAKEEEIVPVLQTIFKGLDENGKDVIFILAPPEIQQQVIQVQRNDAAEAGENTHTRLDVQTAENTSISNQIGSHFEANTALDKSPEIKNKQNESNATFTSHIDENFGYETLVETSKSQKKGKRCKAASLSQTQRKKWIGVHPEAKKSASQTYSNRMHPSQPRLRREGFGLGGLGWKARLKWKSNSNSLKRFKTQCLRGLLKKYFQEKNINNAELRTLMRVMMNTIGGQMMDSFFYFFETFRKNYEVRTEE